MPAIERTTDRGTRVGERALRLVADEFRSSRLSTGASQESVAAAARVSRPRYSKIERAKAPTLTVLEAARIAEVLGLSLSMRLFPDSDPLRDAAQVRLLHKLLGHARPPLRSRTEVPLPQADGRLERRAWDAVLWGGGRRTMIEVETRLYDLQATERRLALKRRDDPGDGFLLVVGASRANRRALRLHPAAWPDLERLKAGAVCRLLESGDHPPTGLMLL